MNASTLQRLGFLFTLLCLTAVAVHPDAAAAAPAHSATAAAPAASSAATGTAAAAKDDHTPATAPPAPTDDAFDDDSDRDSSDWRRRIGAHQRPNRQHHEDGDVVSIGHSSYLESAKRPIRWCRYLGPRP